jgi:hypothetical protein
MGEERNACMFVAEKLGVKRTLGRPWSVLELVI